MLRCVLILTAGASLVSAQELTLANCVRLAEGVPSQVSLARQDRDIASRDITEARAGFLPSTQITGGISITAGAPPAASSISMDRTNTSPRRQSRKSSTRPAGCAPICNGHGLRKTQPQPALASLNAISSGP